MKAFFSFISLILIIFAALSMGLWGFFQIDLIAWLFHGNTSMLSRLVCGIIGLAGIWSLRFLARCKSICK